MVKVGAVAAPARAGQFAFSARCYCAVANAPVLRIVSAGPCARITTAVSCYRHRVRPLEEPRRRPSNTSSGTGRANYRQRGPSARNPNRGAARRITSSGTARITDIGTVRSNYRQRDHPLEPRRRKSNYQQRDWPPELPTSGPSARKCQPRDHTQRRAENEPGVAMTTKTAHLAFRIESSPEIAVLGSQRIRNRPTMNPQFEIRSADITASPDSHAGTRALVGERCREVVRP
jgi:hypothetical protein